MLGSRGLFREDVHTVSNLQAFYSNAYVYSKNTVIKLLPPTISWKSHRDNGYLAEIPSVSRGKSHNRGMSYICHRETSIISVIELRDMTFINA